MADRPQFDEIKTYEEFVKYYWYRSELEQICKEHGIDSSGGKIELNRIIEQYFRGVKVTKKKVVKPKVTTEILTLDTILLDCGFRFGPKFRNFYIEQTGNPNLKFNADMVATAKKVREENDRSFTLGDMLDVYYGKKEYAKYDKSSCQWNQFLKDFCADEANQGYSNKLKVASALWTAVRDSTDEKVYKHELLTRYKELLEGL